MNCQDNSRLKVPLPELCKTTDIGCVPMTSGKPDCPPEADQLPLAYDKNSQTLWLFDCESRQWMPFSKFTLAELQEVSLDNIRNICELLKIPVYYNPGGGTVQGSMPLAEFGKELLKCQSLEGKVAVLPNGLTSFTIQGLDSLEPFYVRWENLTVSGDGTSSSPLVVKGQDPITKWPKKTEADVDNAVQPMLAANLDGEMVQVPYPKKPCAYPKLTKAQVEAANEVLLIGCVDEANVKIPYPDQPQDYDSLTDDQVDDLPPGTGKWLIAVIDGKVYRIPFPKEPCEYDRATSTELVTGMADIIACLNGKKVKIPLSDLATGIDASMEGVCTYDRATSAELMAGTADVIACLDGKRVRVPLADLTRAVEGTSETSGCTLPFATLAELNESKRATIAMCVDGVMRQVVVDDTLWNGLEWPDIPIVRDIPTGPPAPGTGPFRIDCDGHLWIWDAAAQDWFKFGGSDAPDNTVPWYSSISGNVTAPCSDVLVRGYYLDKTDQRAGYKPTKFNMTQLANALDNCGLVGEDELARYFKGGFVGTTVTFTHTALNVPAPAIHDASKSRGDNIGISLKNINLVNSAATYALHSFRFLSGSGTHTWGSVGQYGTGSYSWLQYTTARPGAMNGGLITLTNPFPERECIARVVPGIIIRGPTVPQNHTLTCVGGVTDNAALSDYRFLCAWGTVYDDATGTIVVRDSCNWGAPRPVLAVAVSSNIWHQRGWQVPEQTASGSVTAYAPQASYFRVPAKGTKNVYARMYFTWYAISTYFPGYNVTPVRSIAGVVNGAQFIYDITYLPAW